VNGAGGQFFSGSGCAGDEYGSISGRNSFDDGEEFPHHRRLADESGSFRIDCLGRFLLVDG
jgi:hypothetical protein